jgi:hypothetical protein
MTKKPTTLQQLMDDEQPPKSPEALDQAILDHARAHARARAKPAAGPGWLERLTAGWLPLLAAASVASVAVIIVQQQPPSAVLHDSTDYLSKVQSKPVRRELALDSSSQKKNAAGSMVGRQAEREADEERFMAQRQSLLSQSGDRLASAAAAERLAPSEAADFAPEAPASASSGVAMLDSMPAAMADSSAEILTEPPQKTTARAIVKTPSARPQPQAANRPVATTSSATFIAQGLQQRWQLQVGDSEVRFIEADGTRHNFGSEPSALDPIKENQPLQLSNQQHQISITLHGAACDAERLDDQQQVTVVFDQQSLAGCGKSNH